MLEFTLLLDHICTCVYVRTILKIMNIWFMWTIKKNVVQEKKVFMLSSCVYDVFMCLWIAIVKKKYVEEVGMYIWALWGTKMTCNVKLNFHVFNVKKFGVLNRICFNEFGYKIVINCVLGAVFVILLFWVNSNLNLGPTFLSFLWWGKNDHCDIYSLINL